LATKMIPAISGTKTSPLFAEISAELKDAMIRARTVSRSETNYTGYSSWNNARYGSGKLPMRDPTKIR
jgi:hypothetical protein